MKDTFYGNKVSAYGLEHGYVDYACLAKSFDAVLCNKIVEVDEDFICNQLCGTAVSYYNNETGDEISEEAYYELSTEEQSNYYESYTEVYQWYLVTAAGYSILEDAGELVYYSEKLDCYVWGVTHYGTSWDYVLTNIELDEN